MCFIVMQLIKAKRVVSFINHLLEHGEILKKLTAVKTHLDDSSSFDEDDARSEGGVRKALSW